MGIATAHALSVSMGGEFLAWEIATGRSVAPPPPGVNPPSACDLPRFEHKGVQYLIRPDGGTDVVLWDLDKGRRAVRFAGHTGLVYCLAYLPEKDLLLTGGADKTLRLWDLWTGKEQDQFRHPDWVTCTAFSAGGKAALSGCRDRIVRLWGW